MIFQVRTTRQQHNPITGVFAAWEAREIYEHTQRREAPGQEHTRPLAEALLAAHPWPSTSATDGMCLVTTAPQRNKTLS